MDENTQTIYRKANVSPKQAIAELESAFPGSEVTEFEAHPATVQEARVAKTTPGNKIFVATLRLADDSESPEPPESDSGPSEEKEPAPPKAEGPEDAVDDAPPEGPPAESKPSAGPHDGPAGPEEHKMKPEEEMVHLLKQILDAVSGGDKLGPEPGMDDLGPGGPPPPPHGAPHGPGPGGPPPGPGGPMGHGGPPLPPPVEKSGPGVAFAHYDAKAPSFTVIRRQANELGLRGLKAEVEQVYPTHRVAKISTAGLAVVDDLQVDLAANNIAVITLTAK